MESVAPPLSLLLFVKASILKNSSVYEAIEIYLKKESKSQFIINLNNWFVLIGSGKETEACIKNIKSPYRQALLEILELGIEGHPILKKLEALELRLVKAIDEELDGHLRKIPIYSLFPLLFLQLPSLMILGFLPFLQKLTKQIGG